MYHKYCGANTGDTDFCADHTSYKCVVCGKQGTSVCREIVDHYRGEDFAACERTLCGAGACQTHHTWLFHQG